MKVFILLTPKLVAAKPRCRWLRPPTTKPVDTGVVSRLARCVLPTHKKQPSQNSQVTKNQDRVVFYLPYPNAGGG